MQTIVTDGTVDTEVEKVPEPRKEAGDVGGVNHESNRQRTVTADVTREPPSRTQALPTGVNGDDGDIKKQSYSKANTRPIKPSNTLRAWEDV